MAVAKQSKKAVGQTAQPKMQFFDELGEVAVDSGQLMITDPAYLQEVDGKKLYEQLLSGGIHVEKPFCIGGVLSGTHLSNTWGKKYLGLNIADFGGDGVFPVYSVYEDTELVGIFIDLRENRWESFQSERAEENLWQDKAPGIPPTDKTPATTKP